VKRTSLSVPIVSAYADPHVGGVEVVAEQARSLAALGHDVTVVTSHCGAGKARRPRGDDHTVIPIPAWDGHEGRWRVAVPVWSPSVAWRLARRTRNADIVHVHDAYHASSVLAVSFAELRRQLPFIAKRAGIVEYDKAVVKLTLEFVYWSVGRLT
jgi:D-inositol-3-phosphate glycosyltransferase